MSRATDSAIASRPRREVLARVHHLGVGGREATDRAGQGDGERGADVDHGAAAHDEVEAAVNRLRCERAERVVVAADSSKPGRRAFARICAAESVDTLVTDTDTDTAAEPETVRRFEEAGVRVVAV